MPQLHTHYDNLKVARNAPPEVIRAAYKTLSQKFHPDRNPDKVNATRTFQMISLAYEVLSDPTRRKVHDEWINAEETKTQPFVNFQDAAPFTKIGQRTAPRSSALHATASDLKNWLSFNRLFRYFFWLLLPTLILLIAVAV